MWYNYQKFGIKPPQLNFKVINQRVNENLEKYDFEKDTKGKTTTELLNKLKKNEIAEEGSAASLPDEFESNDQQDKMEGINPSQIINFSHQATKPSKSFGSAGPPLWHKPKNPSLFITPPEGPEAPEGAEGAESSEPSTHPEEEQKIPISKNTVFPTNHNITQMEDLNIGPSVSESNLDNKNRKHNYKNNKINLYKDSAHKLKIFSKQIKSSASSGINFLTKSIFIFHFILIFYVRDFLCFFLGIKSIPLNSKMFGMGSLLDPIFNKQDSDKKDTQRQFAFPDLDLYETDIQILQSALDSLFATTINFPVIFRPLRCLF
jgi:hypothetical protein